MSDNAIILGGVPVEIQAGDGSTKRFTGTAYSGGIMSVAPFGPLAIDLDGLELPATVPLRLDHGDGLMAVVGQGQCRIEAGRLLVSGIIASETEAGKHLVGLAKSGVTLELSVGARPVEKSLVSPGEVVRCNGRSLSAEDGFLLVHKSKLFEISIVSRGADVGGTNISIAAAQGKKGTSTMTTTPDTDVLTTERERFETICARCDRAIEIVGAPAASKIRSDAIAAGWTLAETEAALLKCENAALRLERVRAEYPKGPTITSGAPRGDKVAIQGALFRHLGYESVGEKILGAQAMEAGAALRCTSFMDIIKASLTVAGRDIPASRDDMITPIPHPSVRVDLGKLTRGWHDRRVTMDRWPGVEDQGWARTHSTIRRLSARFR